MRPGDHGGHPEEEDRSRFGWGDAGEAAQNGYDAHSVYREFRPESSGAEQGWGGPGGTGAGGSDPGIGDSGGGWDGSGGSGGDGSWAGSSGSGGGGSSGGDSSWAGSGGSSSGGSGDAGDGGWCDGCGGCDCNFSLLSLLRLSTLLVLAAQLLPDTGTRTAVRGLVRGYRRTLTRFTPRCPQTPSCSAYALTAVDELGTRHGLRAAAHSIAGCGAVR